MAQKQRQCKSCGSTYPVTQADGMAYFHACAPVGVNADGSPKERGNKRDENIKLDSHGQSAGDISDGAGFTDL